MRFTASAAPILAQCLYPFRPDVEAPEADRNSEATVGTVAWARVAAYFEHRPDPGIPEDLTPAERDDVEAYYRAGIRYAEPRRRVASRTEVKYAWHPVHDQARELPKTYDDAGRENLRDYSLATDEEVCGSIDLEDWGMDQVLIIEDIKTGFTPLEEYLPQLRTLAMFAARRHKTRKVRARLVKLHTDREAEVLEQMLDGFALDAIAADLRIRLEAAPRAEPTPGPWCTARWCKVFLACPAIKRDVAEVADLVPVEALVRSRKLTEEFVSHDYDAGLIGFISLVDKWCERMKKVIKARTPEGGVALSDGRMLREIVQHGESVSKEELEAKAREFGVKAGLTDEQIDIELAALRKPYKRSGGLKVTKALKVAS